MRRLELIDGALDVNSIVNSWFDEFKQQNYGAVITFVGIVRDENGIDGLSFDIYKPILNSWFDAWQNKMKKQNAVILMAHSINDVLNHQSSFVAGVCSPKRKVALKLIEEFVEDFKASAPIWKYDIKNGKRVWAKDRSQKIVGAGLLA